MNLFLLVFAAANALAHGHRDFPHAVCDATCYFSNARSALERQTVTGTGKDQAEAWKSLGQACQKLGRKGKAELQLWNPQYDNNSSADPEFFAATAEKACSELLSIGAAFKKAEGMSPTSAEQTMKLGNYRVTYNSARKVSPTQTIAQHVRIFQNDNRLYEIDESAASVLLEKYGEQISVILQGSKPDSVLSKQLITMNGIKSHCHGAEDRGAAGEQEELRNYLRSLHCVK